MKLFRETVRAFTEREIVPHLEEWERAGEVPRELHRHAAEAGILGAGWPEEAGGEGGDYLHSVALTEEIIQAGGSSGLTAALFTHGIALPHIFAAGDPSQIERFVRPTLRGEKIGALGVTEADGGSDVAALRTRAERDGDHYVVSGSKTYIPSGARADFVTTAVRTGDRISLLVVEEFDVVRRLDKMGWLCSDTAELAFRDVRVPAANLVGEEGTGLAQIMRNFVSERLSMAVQGYATAQRCLDLSVEWAKARRAFGESLAEKGVIRQKLAEMARRTEVARTYVRSVAERYVAGEDVRTEAAIAKNAAVEAAEFATYEAVQIHGGLGYMRDGEVERHYRDARILGIGGGTTEIMNELIVRSLLSTQS